MPLTYQQFQMCYATGVNSNYSMYVRQQKCKPENG